MSSRLIWTLVANERPVQQNAYRRMHHLERATYDKRWRQWGFVLARQAKVPHLERITIAIDTIHGRRPCPDIMANSATVKAFIDGLVDASVIENDRNTIASITFREPTYEKGKDALIIEIHSQEGEGT